MRLCAAALMAALIAGPASAGEGGDIARDALYEGGLAAAVDQLEPLAAGGDAEAAFGLGMVRFVLAIEDFSQALYRHGFAPPDAGRALQGAPLAIPVPANPNPEPLDYATVRDALSALADGLDAAGADLEVAAGMDPFTLHIDPLKVRIDANGDGKSEEAESIGHVFAMAFGMPDAGGGMLAIEPGVVPDTFPDLTIGFDNADGYWLTGYSHVLAAQADFLLAHNFETFVNATFHRLFPMSKLPMQEYARGGMLMMDPDTDTAIADVIAAVHTINWRVIEPDRLRRVRERFGQVTALSRQNWAAIRAETDDDRELLPGPHQTALDGEAVITEEMVAAWHETLDVADRILAGELMVPHWRFREGIDLKAYFETATRFDVVMLLTGYDALPFLRAGPVASESSFAAANEVFGSNLMGFVFWFN